VRMVLLALLLGGCVDHGRCFQSHSDHVAASTWVQMIVMPKGGMIPIVHYIPAHDVTVCDRWEYPRGRRAVR